MVGYLQHRDCGCEKVLALDPGLDGVGYLTKFDSSRLYMFYVDIGSLASHNWIPGSCSLQLGRD